MFTLQGQLSYKYIMHIDIKIAPSQTNSNVCLNASEIVSA